MESAEDGVESVVLPVRAHTRGVGRGDGGILVERAEDRRSAHHEVSAGGAEGHGYLGRMAIRIILPMPQWGQGLNSFSVMASSS